MSTEFKREERYIVFKLSDVEEHFTPGEKQQLARLAEVQRVGREEAGKAPLECVVVEADWPEYEPTWKAIQARMTGAHPAPSLASGDVSLISEGKTQPAPSIPEGWKPIPEKHPTFDLVDLRLADGSVLCGCVPQSDGDYWWEGPSGEVFIDPRYAPATHWRLAAAPEAKP